ncbi:hypothetical protein CEXT_328111 [Caerostris extrusa]|uniref:Uncharacterized protein n=1 Tax=Caerostris extrusa TaxID=172846 RepID=A0AAV4Q9S0_CAEEX|nr:hypothetical protein CEXT_328111 [Caerostris extrusa]
MSFPRQAIWPQEGRADFRQARKWVKWPFVGFRQQVGCEHIRFAGIFGILHSLFFRVFFRSSIDLGLWFPSLMSDSNDFYDSYEKNGMFLCLNNGESKNCLPGLLQI